MTTTPNVFQDFPSSLFATVIPSHPWDHTTPVFSVSILLYWPWIVDRFILNLAGWAIAAARHQVVLTLHLRARAVESYQFTVITPNI